MRSTRIPFTWDKKNTSQRLPGGARTHPPAVFEPDDIYVLWEDTWDVHDKLNTLNVTELGRYYTHSGIIKAITRKQVHVRSRRIPGVGRYHVTLFSQGFQWLQSGIWHRIYWTKEPLLASESL